MGVLISILITGLLINLRQCYTSVDTNVLCKLVQPSSPRERPALGVLYNNKVQVTTEAILYLPNYRFGKNLRPA